jgi:hypothetical protein
MARLRSQLLPGALLCGFLASEASAQLTDITQTPNSANSGIKKSLPQQIGAGRGDLLTPDSSAYIIARDPFRAIVRGRQLFQRKFTVAQGNGPRTGDGVGNIEQDGSIGAGLADSCALCHGRPLGSAGFGGNVFTRPNSRDAPHLFGLGLVEMLADEITRSLRSQRDLGLQTAQQTGMSQVVSLSAKGTHYGSLLAHPNGGVDPSGVEGVDPDLRVRPFFAQGGTISIREFVVGAFNAEMGLESADPDLLAASQGQDVTTPSGMVLSGSQDNIEAPPAAHVFDDPDGDGVTEEVPTSLIDHMEFYLLNYFKPGTLEQTDRVQRGRVLFHQIGCTDCHSPTMVINHDRRVADVNTVEDLDNANVVFNKMYATATPLHSIVDDGFGLPTLKQPLGGPFGVENFFSDLKRHDLGPNFHEKNFDDSLQTEFITEPLWGVGSTPPYGHDGRSPTLEDVILRHGGEALPQRTAFSLLARWKKDRIVEFLNSLVLFAPPDTSSNLDQANIFDADFPLSAQGSIDLSVLFNNPNDKE